MVRDIVNGSLGMSFTPFIRPVIDHHHHSKSPPKLYLSISCKFLSRKTMFCSYLNRRQVLIDSCTDSLVHLSTTTDRISGTRFLHLSYRHARDVEPGSECWP
jgi:hypothetical protein